MLFRDYGCASSFVVTSYLGNRVCIVLCDQSITLYLIVFVFVCLYVSENDLAQKRFARDDRKAKLADNFYVRWDGTRAFYFSEGTCCSDVRGAWCCGFLFACLQLITWLLLTSVRVQRV